MFDAGALGLVILWARWWNRPIALKKFIQATRIAFPQDLHSEMDFYINLETIYGHQEF